MILEIKPCGLASIIWGWKLWLISFIGEHLDYFLFLLVSRTGTVGWTKRWVKVPKCVLAITFLASNSLHNITMEDKNNHAYVTTQRILNKFIEINFSVGCMVWPWLFFFKQRTDHKAKEGRLLLNTSVFLQPDQILFANPSRGSSPNP